MATTNFVPGTVITSTWLNEVDQVVHDADGANYVSFTPAGTGAVARSGQSKMRDRVSVFDYMTTAEISDVQAGSALVNVYAAINTAITYAATIGADVFFPAGKYYVNGSVVMRNKVSLTGTGKSASEIYFGASGLFSMTGTAGSYIGNLSIEKIGFTDQTGAVATAFALTYSTRVSVIDCVFYNLDITLSAYTYITFDMCDLFGGTLNGDHPTINSLSEALKLSKCNGSGYAVSIKDTADVFISDCSFLGPAAQVSISRGENPANYYAPVFISNLVVDSGDNEGIKLEGVCPHLSNVFISSGRTNLKDGLWMKYCREGSLTNVQSRYNGQHGINMDQCESILVTGCDCNDNKNYGIRIADCSYLSFIGNDCSYVGAVDWYGGSYAQTDGISDQPGTSTNITCINNTMIGNSGNALYLPHASNTILGNYGYTTNVVQGVLWKNGVDLTMALGDASFKFTNIHTQAIRSNPVAVANLPSAAASVGQRQMVSDANATTFASVVAAGGANIIPVYCDGTNWRIG